MDYLIPRPLSTAGKCFIILLMSKTVTSGEGQGDAIEPTAKSGPTRRRLIKGAAGFTVVCGIDLGVGQLQNSLFISRSPKVHVWPQPESRATLIAAPGTSNSGYHMGRLLSYALGNRATVVAVEYAETNVDPTLITAGVKEALSNIDPKQRQKTGHYWLSSGGVIMTPVAHALGEQTDLALLDSAPLTKSDLRGRNGVFARIPEFMSRSRLLDLVFMLGKDLSIPPAAQDKADWIPAELAESHRHFTVHADLMTSAAEVEALSRNILPNTLAGFAAAAYFMTCPPGAGHPERTAGVDPLVITELAHPGWNAVFGGGLELYADPHRAPDSHGIGPIYPGGIMNKVEHSLA